MDAYDNGASYITLDRAWMYFIPRAIWPSKPILYGPALDFYRLLSGRAEAVSFLGLSIYGDLYLQFGWGGVFVGCILFGWLLGITASRAIQAVRSREFAMLPFVAMALELALLSPNKFILSGVIGPLPIMIFYYSAMVWYLRRRGKKLFTWY